MSEATSPDDDCNLVDLLRSPSVDDFILWSQTQPEFDHLANWNDDLLDSLHSSKEARQDTAPKDSVNFPNSSKGIKNNHSSDKNTSQRNEKFKATNFPALSLNIGSWKWTSKNESTDLIAKCYFKRRRFLWEILDGSLKSKFEIQWSQIV